MTTWDDRYAATPNLFGDDPSPLLLEFRPLLAPGMQALAIGDGEGRNGVWLAQQGLEVLSIDLSAVALQRARARAAFRGVALRALCMDVLAWEWPAAAFDLVILVFVHFPAAQKRRLHQAIARALAPGGMLMLECFHRDQIAFASGGPEDPDLLYTFESLAADFADFEIMKLARVDTDVVLAGEPRGKGAAVHFVARKPAM